MRVDWIVLANAAEVRDELVNLLGGGWNVAYREAYPAAFYGAIALTLVLDPRELATPHHLEIAILDQEGKVLADARSPIALPPPAPPWVEVPANWDIRVSMAVNLSGVQIPAPGLYHITVSVDGLHLRDPLEVKFIQASPSELLPGVQPPREEATGRTT